MLVALTIATAAQAQSYYYVDCSGTNRADFPTISAALATARTEFVHPCNWHMQ